MHQSPSSKVLFIVKHSQSTPSPNEDQAPDAERVDSFIQRIKCISWSTFYLLDRHLSAG